MPLNVIIVRHAQSEWNIAHEQNKQGNSSLMRKLSQRAFDDPDLTSLGEDQALKTGEWLREYFGLPNEFWTSPSLRAKRTAISLGFGKDVWKEKQDLQERSWGDISIITQEDMKIEKNARLFEWKKRDPFGWKPPNGESLFDVMLRVNQIIANLGKVKKDKSIIFVSHGEFISVLRIRLECWTKERYIAQSGARGTKDWVNNGQVLWYSRTCPKTGKVSKHLKWLYSIWPWKPSESHDCWQKI